MWFLWGTLTDTTHPPMKLGGPSSVHLSLCISLQPSNECSVVTAGPGGCLPCSYMGATMPLSSRRRPSAGLAPKPACWEQSLNTHTLCELSPDPFSTRNPPHQFPPSHILTIGPTPPAEGVGAPRCHAGHVCSYQEHLHWAVNGDHKIAACTICTTPKEI